jgi:hypothetical protein
VIFEDIFNGFKAFSKNSRLFILFPDPCIHIGLNINEGRFERFSGFLNPFSKM